MVLQLATKFIGLARLASQHLYLLQDTQKLPDGLYCLAHPRLSILQSMMSITEPEEISFKGWLLRVCQN